MKGESAAKGEPESSETQSKANHGLTNQSNTRGKTASDTAGPTSYSGTMPGQKTYMDVDQASICNDAASLLWKRDAGSSTSNLPITDKASSMKDDDDFIVLSSNKRISAAALVCYVQTNRIGDAAPVIVRGCKYVFDNCTRRWLTHPVTVRVLHHNRGIHQDNYFATFAIELLDTGKPAVPMFARVYRHNIDGVVETDYYSLGQAQALCEEFARDYTRTDARHGYLKFHMPLLTNRVVVRLDLHSVLDPAIRHSRRGFFSYRTQDTRQILFLMEPNTIACETLGVSFASLEVEKGKRYERGDSTWLRDIYSDIAEGFSHFTYVRSRGCMVAHGLVRSNGYLLDPLFHTTDRERFRMGDGGRRAMSKWFERHQCSDTCRALGIFNASEDCKPFKNAPLFVNPLDMEENHYTSYLRSIRQMPAAVRMDTVHFSDEEAEEAVLSTVVGRSDLTSTTNANPLVSNSSAPLKVTCDAVKYVFLPSCDKWMEVPMRLTVCTPTVPVAVDDKYVSFTIEEIQEKGKPVPMRARFIPRRDARDADYYHVGDAYYLCVTLGQAFRKYRSNSVFERELDFYAVYTARVPKENIPDSVMPVMDDSSFFGRTTADSGDVMFLVEPEFQPLTPQHASNTGDMAKDAEGFDDLMLRQVVDAFSHFTLHKSGNYLLVCHLKCEHGLLKEPNINTSNGCGFGTLNGGQVGIDAWARMHKCNDVCKFLGMEPVPRRLKLYDISASQLMRYINLVQAHAMGTGCVFTLASPWCRMSDRMLPAAAATANNETEGVPARFAAGASPATVGVTSFARPISSNGDEITLRPWVDDNRSPGAATAKKSAAQRRTLTQQELLHLQSKGINTKYIFSATRYDLNIDDLTWTSKRIFVRIVNPERGIGQGGMRVCFEITEVDPVACKEVVMVAKMYRRTIKNVVEKDYFTSVTVQKLSALFAKEFNHERKEDAPLRLNVLEGAVVALDRAVLSPELLAKRTGFFSYRTEDTKRAMFCMETKLAGPFTKYSGNMGEAYPTNECRLSLSAARERTMIFETVEALSHYSLERSGGGLLVCDMQGVKNDLTDLEVHTYDGQGLGVGNLGARGIQKFAVGHRCTSVCRSLGLQKLYNQQRTVTESVRMTNRFVVIFERSKEIANME
ncbi:hypothetical protein NXY56_008055 [Leishmania guyanensis]|uniref:Putative related to elongation factor-2 kinase efk-1b isoform-like protein n=1 Tax=Leishmania guyanensis TaxID=5670 RepID=A0A1E1J7X5_LEIGU|nr:Putative related to elongation factor-2 kinase efk-1b isoform-like protein [Leishmania guyanensis]